ncbi:MAG: response regulator [Minisyncoccia bacterium]|jgi:DNA-binding response OmpR family regulator
MDNPKKILLVEDEPMLSNLLKQRLEQEGIVVTAVPDGIEAVKVLKQEKPDLILLDIILPKMSGFEVMEEMKGDPTIQSAPVVIVSNLGQVGDVERAQKFGAVGYFVKAQLSIEDLVSKVKGFLA